MPHSARFPVRNVMGVPIHAMKLMDVLDVVDETIARRGRLLIGVVNAAKMVNMRKDALLRDSVLGSDLVLADGMAVVWAARLLGQRLPERVAGIDLMLGMLQRGSLRCDQVRPHDSRNTCEPHTNDNGPPAICLSAPSALSAPLRETYFPSTNGGQPCCGNDSEPGSKYDGRANTIANGQRRYRFYCLGATEEVSRIVAERIARDYPGVVLAGRHHGYFSEADEPALVSAIRDARPDILLVAMSPPRKEIFLARWFDQLGIPVCHGVGGAFDVLAGKTKRAPALWQKLGLEWLYRVLQEPRRMWKRYLVTNVRFSLHLAREAMRRLLRCDRLYDDGMPSKSMSQEVDGPVR